MGNWGKAKREKLKALVAMVGASGSGKTFSSLLLAKGMIMEKFPDLDPNSEEFWAKIGVLDSEHDRAKIYADIEKHDYYIGEFLHQSLTPPFTPDQYIKAIKEAGAAGIEVLIVDSTTHFWEYLKDWQQELGGRYQDWKKPTAKYKELIDAFTRADLDMIATMRAKQAYSLETSDTGKLKVAKLGEKPNQRDDFEFEFLLSFLFDENHNARATKDNTPLFEQLGEFKINPNHGKALVKWLEKGETPKPKEKPQEKPQAQDKTEAIQLVDVIQGYAAEGHEKTKEEIDRLTKTKAVTSVGGFGNLPIEKLRKMAEYVADFDKQHAGELPDAKGTKENDEPLPQVNPSSGEATEESKQEDKVKESQRVYMYDKEKDEIFAVSPGTEQNYKAEVLSYDEYIELKNKKAKEAAEKKAAEAHEKVQQENEQPQKKKGKTVKDFTKPQLQAHAKKFGIEGYKSMTKDQLWEALKAAKQAAQNEDGEHEQRQQQAQ